MDNSMIGLSKPLLKRTAFLSKFWVSWRRQSKVSKLESRSIRPHFRTCRSWIGSKLNTLAVLRPPCTFKIFISRLTAQNLQDLQSLNLDNSTQRWDTTPAAKAPWTRLTNRPSSTSWWLHSARAEFHSHGSMSTSKRLQVCSPSLLSCHSWGPILQTMIVPRCIRWSKASDSHHMGSPVWIKGPGSTGSKLWPSLLSFRHASPTRRILPSLELNWLIPATTSVSRRLSSRL